MEETIKVELIIGAKLTDSDLEIINQYRRERFGSSDWNHTKNNYFQNRTFILIRDLGQLVAFGLIREIQLTFKGSKYDSLGIGSIISIVERKGYGKRVVRAASEFAQSSGKVILGFCEPVNREFYRKCGYTIWENGMQNFVYIDETGKENYDEGDVLFFNDVDGIIGEAQKADLTIAHYAPHW